jgi:hypothetical protein
MKNYQLKAVKNIVLLFLMLAGLNSFAQAPKITSSFIVNGRVKTPKTFLFTDLEKMGIHHLGDIVITNHQGDVKGTAKELSGVLLKEVLSTLEIDAENPKVLSEYYFVCYASDGYKVVYSWNELFNTPVGNSVYIVTAKDHKSMKDLNENILMISSHDTQTGRRYVKNLETIRVVRAQ